MTTAAIQIEAGGCAPPIVVIDPMPLNAVAEAARAIDRAHVEAGIMSLADYVRIYGGGK